MRILIGEGQSVRRSASKHLYTATVTSYISARLCIDVIVSNRLPYNTVRHAYMSLSHAFREYFAAFLGRNCLAMRVVAGVRRARLGTRRNTCPLGRRSPATTRRNRRAGSRASSSTNRRRGSTNPPCCRTHSQTASMLRAGRGDERN